VRSVMARCRSAAPCSPRAGMRRVFVLPGRGNLVKMMREFMVLSEDRLEEVSKILEVYSRKISEDLD
ncbi:MAG: hypothetical protein JXR72_07175, partial [Proteobacteria bacterium]|nr:hypothetical protein [Pseudomonadota bacterium]